MAWGYAQKPQETPWQGDDPPAASIVTITNHQAGPDTDYYQPLHAASFAGVWSFDKIQRLPGELFLGEGRIKINLSKSMLHQISVFTHFYTSYNFLINSVLEFKNT